MNEGLTTPPAPAAPASSTAPGGLREILWRALCARAGLSHEQLRPHHAQAGEQKAEPQHPDLG